MSYYHFSQDNTMDEYEQDPEPPLNDEEYQLLRNDTFLTRIGSNNFAALLDPAPESDLARQQPQHQQHQQHQHQHQQHTAFPPEPELSNVLFADTGLVLTGSELHLNETKEWNSMELRMPAQELEAPMSDLDGRGSTSLTPDSTPTPIVPSLQPWPGQYDFTISLLFENKDRNKWCFSKEQNKLYLCPNIAVPINVKVLQWIDGSITITPVFKESRFRLDSVMPCYNCKYKAMSDTKDHIVLVEGQERDYKVINERFVVSMPLHPPPPGEVVTTLLVSLTCLTSCVGGPNRRPFSLVFTLHDSTGAVIGRQVLDLKCCKCPSRDMMNDEKTVRDRNSSASSNNLDHVESSRKTSQGSTTGVKRRQISRTEQNFKNLSIPVEYVPQVRRYTNGLIAEEYVRRNNHSILLFPEDEI